MATTVVDITGYTRMLVPDGVGLLTDVATHNQAYPGLRQWAQFIAFHNGSQWLVVNTQQTSPTVTNFTVDAVAETCTVTHEAGITVNEDVVVAEEAAWRSAVDDYRTFSLAQSYTKKRKGGLIHEFDMVSFASYVNPATIETYIPILEGYRGVTRFNNYRDDGLDDNYPDYGQKAGWAANFQTHIDRGYGLMPYINGLLWDDQNADYAANIGLMVEQSATPVAWGANGSATGNLIFVCPSQSTSWKATLRTQFDAIATTDGTTCGMIYLDLIGGTNPENTLCDETGHGHDADDRDVYIPGIQAILDHFSDVDVCMEFVSEPFISRADICLNYTTPGNSRDADRVPLYAHFFADRIRIMGWKIDAGDSKATRLDEAKLAYSPYGCYSFSPHGSVSRDTEHIAYGDEEKYVFAGYKPKSFTTWRHRRIS